MTLIIGTDEAGYGPNLGPLVVAGSMWQVPDDEPDLYEVLNSVICRSPKPDDPLRQISIGDSKSLFKSGQSLANLEQSVLTMLGSIDRKPCDLFDLFQTVAEQNGLQLASETTYRWDQFRMPTACSADQVDSLARTVRDACRKHNVACLGITACVVFPQEFNRGLNTFGNKASLLSTMTCRVIKRLLQTAADPVTHEAIDGSNVKILCDRHGGRMRYAGLLQQELTDQFVRVMHEDRSESVYQWHEPPSRNFESRFVVKGERHLPIALGSMVAKYLRELSMQAWNLFWREQLPTLHPTAGYPVDARRFKQEITSTQIKLNVPDELIWRNK